MKKGKGKVNGHGNVKKAVAVGLIGASAMGIVVGLGNEEAKGLEKATVTINDGNKIQIETSKLTAWVTSAGRYGLYLKPENYTVFYNKDSAYASVYTNQDLPKGGLPNTFASLTTVSGGFRVVNGNEIELVKTDNVFNYTLRVSIVNATSSGAFMKMEMVAKNLTSSNQDTAFSFNSDLMVNNADTTPITKIENGWQGGSGVVVTAYYDGVYHTTPADFIFLGHYNSQVPTAPSAYVNNTTVVNGIDSGAGFYYTRKTVAPNRERKESYLIGVGVANKAPTLNVTSPGSGATVTKYAGDNLDISGSVADIDGVSGEKLSIYYAWENGDEGKFNDVSTSTSGTNFSGVVKIPTSVSGTTQTLKIWAMDEKGGVSAVQSREIKVNPLVTPTLSLTGKNTTGLNIKVNGLENPSEVTYELTDVTNLSTVYNLSSDNLEKKLDGLIPGKTYEFKVRAKAPSGIYSGSSSLYRYTTSINNPNMNIVSNRSGDISGEVLNVGNDSSVKYTLRVVNALTGVETRVTNGKVGDTLTTNVPTDIKYKVYIDAESSDGEIKSTYIGESYVDTIAPNAPTYTADKVVPTNEDVNVSINYSETGGEKEYKIDDGNWLTYTGAIKVGLNNTKITARQRDSSGNVSSESVYTVTNIDKEAPSNPTFSVDKTAPTNEDVKVRINYSNEVGTKKEYKIGKGEWEVYGGGLVIDENTTVYARETDSVGNVSGEVSQEISNIDKEPPNAPEVKANTQGITNQDVILSAEYSEDSEKKEYRINEGMWLEYKGEIVVDRNKKVEFRGTDKAGNGSNITSYIVSNIDKEPPSNPRITADKSSITNENVNISIVYSEDSEVKQYRIDGGEWLSYTGKVVMKANGKVEARGQDKAGNYSNEVGYTVSNIDKEPPTKPILSANITEPTSRDVFIGINYSADSVKREYKVGNGEWLEYKGGVVVGSNEVVYARGQDEAGNYSETGVYEVTNIDKIAPSQPNVSADKITATNGDVKVTADYPSDVVVKEYKIDDGNWLAYTGELTIKENSTLVFRGYDLAWNVSEETEYKVTNIDRIPPKNPIVTADKTNPTNEDVVIKVEYSEDSARKEYKIGDGEWQDYYGGTGIIVSVNTEVYVRGQDEAGNYSGEVKYSVSNIDKESPTNPTISVDKTEPTNTDVKVTVSYSNDSINKEYRVDGGEWKPYRDTLVIAKNSKIEVRGQDVAGNYTEIVTYRVTNIDKEAPDKPSIRYSTNLATNEDVIVSIDYSGDSSKKEYRIDGGKWLEYTGSIIIDKNGVIEARGQDEAGNYSEEERYEISNIDKTLPDAPIIKISTTEPTNEDIKVKINYTEDSVKKEYKIGEGEWLEYKGEISIGANTVIYARGYDEAKNGSAVSEYRVTNIDKEAPTKPSIAVSETKPTNKDILATITYSEDSEKKYYRINNGEWVQYKLGIVVRGNQKVEAYSEDKAGNKSEIETYEITNIDKEAPESPIYSVSNTEPTNGDVIVSAVYSVDSEKKEYRLNNGEWLGYIDGIRFKENGVIEFRGTDKAGNQSVTSKYIVTNIDKIAPLDPWVSPSSETITNKDVKLVVNYGADSAKRYYKYIEDGKDGANVEWQEYEGAITAKGNGVLYVYSEDSVGNKTNIVHYEVTNIDKVIPNVPSIKLSTLEETNEDVEVTIDKVSTDTNKIYYKVGNTSYQEYTKPFKVSENGTITYYVTDYASNESDRSVYNVVNIDKEAPTVDYYLSTEKPTNSDVYVTVVGNDNTRVASIKYVVAPLNTNYSKEDVIRKGKEIANGGEIRVTENGKVYIVVTDIAGNSTLISKEVKNIDKSLLSMPTISTNTSKPTNQALDVVIVYDKASTKRYVKIGKGQWQSYSGSLKVNENVLIQAKSENEAGTMSAIADYTISNIDKVSPKVTIKQTVTSLTNESVPIKVTASDEVGIKGIYWYKGDVTLDVLKEKGSKLRGTIFKADDSGIYSIGVEDTAGNITLNKIEVTNIKKAKLETARVDKSKIKPLGDNLVSLDVEFKEKGKDVTNYVKVNDGDWVEYTGAITVSVGDKVQAKTMDAYGNSSAINTLKVSKKYGYVSVTESESGKEYKVKDKVEVNEDSQGKITRQTKSESKQGLNTNTESKGTSVDSKGVSTSNENLPQTGEGRNTLIGIGMMGSVLGLFSVIVGNRKRRNKNG